MTRHSGVTRSSERTETHNMDKPRLESETSRWSPRPPIPLSLDSPSISSTRVRTAPYHSYLASLPKHESESLLADGVPSGKPSIVYYLEIASDGTLEDPSTFSCKLNDSFYWQDDDLQMLALRSRLETSVPYAQRIIAVENILPITVEVLGASLNLRPRLFQQHIRDLWAPEGSSRPDFRADVTVPRVWARPGSFGTTIQLPRMIERSWMRTWKKANAQSRPKLLHDYNISPTLFQDGPVPCLPRIFERITAEVRVETDSKWTAILILPPSFDELLPFTKSGKVPREPPSPVHAFSQGYGSREQGTHVNHFTEWQMEYQSFSASGSVMHDPFVLLASLYAHALGYWEAYVDTLDHVVFSLGQPLASVRSNQIKETADIYPQQEFKELVLTNISILSGTLEHLGTLIELEKTSDAFKNLSSSSSSLSMQRLHFSALQARLMRHLPLIQHHVDVVLSQQSILLAHTQIVESRKGIEQADTVKRLTALAFIFIPISTATSFFGMNIRELNPNPRMWVFWVTTIVLLGFALVAANWNRVCRALTTLWERAIDAVGSLAGRGPTVRR